MVWLLLENTHPKSSFYAATQATWAQHLTTLSFGQLAAGVKQQSLLGGRGANL